MGSVSLKPTIQSTVLHMWASLHLCCGARGGGMKAGQRSQEQLKLIQIQVMLRRGSQGDLTTAGI